MTFPLLSVQATFGTLTLILWARYFAVAGAGWAYFRPARDTRLRQDIQYSLLSSLVFAAAGTGGIFAWRAGLIEIYTDPAAHGWPYLISSLPLLLILHETYFYWTHRWLHRPLIFKHVHRAHHLSTHPSAFTSFAFHPVEAAVQALILPALLLVLPVHLFVLIGFLSIMTLTGVINHLGTEVYPRSWIKRGWLDGWVTPSHHAHHHRRGSAHFGLYFTFWDRWMKTQRNNAHPHPSSEPAPENGATIDVLIVGGGLSGGLLAWMLAERRPELAVQVLDRADTPSRPRTWSFHEGDLSPSDMRTIGPLLSASWPRHEVRFPGLTSRCLESPYHSIRSEAFEQKLAQRLGTRWVRTDAVQSLAPRSVRLASGAVMQAQCVLDCRGADTGTESPRGYQKFLGLDVELAHPHGLRHAILMDASVEQKDGFRFLYVLPWDERRLLIEDTRYADHPDVDEDLFTRDIHAYAAEKGWVINRILRTEKAALPIPFEAPGISSAARPSPTALGVRAGLFHCTTGYSFPDAVRTASAICGLARIDSDSVADWVDTEIRRRRPVQRFYAALNRMLFHAAAPTERYRVLKRFYDLPTPLIERFYAGRSTLADRLRILSGKPPVPLLRAARAVLLPPPNPGENPHAAL
jgi:lycopene beta-cyclase